MPWSIGSESFMILLHLLVEFSELFIERDQADPSWKDNILWSDEAIFSPAETVNRHNCVYWDSQNPNRYVEADNLGA